MTTPQGGVVRRGDVVDLLIRDGQSVVLTETRCLRLSEIATSVVTLLEEPTSVRVIEQHLEDRFGAAPEGRIRDILTELENQGLVHWSREAGP